MDLFWNRGGTPRMPGPLLSRSLSGERIHRGHGRFEFKAKLRTGSLTRVSAAWGAKVARPWVAPHLQLDDWRIVMGLNLVTLHRNDSPFLSDSGGVSLAEPVRSEPG